MTKWERGAMQVGHNQKGWDMYSPDSEFFSFEVEDDYDAARIVNEEVLVLVGTVNQHGSPHTSVRANHASHGSHQANHGSHSSHSSGSGGR